MKKLLLFLFIVCHGTIMAQKSTSSELTGKWQFVSASEKDLGNIPANQLPELIFADSTKTVSGSTGCNTITGEYTADRDQLTFGTLVSTNKACPDMEAELYINHFLTGVSTYKIEGDKLFLYDKSDKSKFLVYKRNTLI